MDNIENIDRKKLASSVVLVLVIVVLVVWFYCPTRNRQSYTLADFGINPPSGDCATLKNVQNSLPTSLYYYSKDVSSLHSKIKDLVLKYNGNITSDSVNAYPSTPSTSNYRSYDSAYLTVTFDKVPTDFVSELSTTVKNAGGTDNGYNYGSDGYSTYSTCETYEQNFKSDIFELGILTDALKGEKNNNNISLLGSLISTTKQNLQQDVISLDDVFTRYSKPSITISISESSTYSTGGEE